MKQWRGCCWIGLVVDAFASWRIQAGSRIADRTTIWSFADRIGEAGATAIFKEVTRQLLGKGYRANSGQIIDASLVRVPRQKFSRAERKQLGEDQTPAQWSSAKKSQTDVEATSNVDQEPRP